MTTQTLERPTSSAGSAGDDPLSLCADVASALSRDGELSVMLERVARAIASHLDAAAVACWILDREQNTLVPTARTGCDLPFDGLNAPVPMNQTIIGEVAAARRATIVDDLRTTGDAEIANWAGREGIQSFACVPIETGNTLHGVLAVFRRQAFNDAALFALSAVQKLVASEVERRIDSAEVRKSNEFLQSLVRSAPMAVVSIDRKQNVTLWNQEAEHVFGWMKSDVLGRRYTTVPAAHRASFDEQFRQVLAGQRVPRIETFRQHADGRLVPVQAALSPVFNVAGEIEGAVEILADLSRQKFAEQCLRTQLAVSSVLAGAEDLDEAAPAALRSACEHLGWTCGELWLARGDSPDLARHAFAVVAGRMVERFQSVLPLDEAQPGQGIIGRVLEHRGVWHANLCDLPNVARAALAQRDGLVSAIGMPILHGARVRGVVCFYGENIPKPERSLHELMSNMASLFVQFLDRQETKTSLRTAEENLRQSQKMDAIGLLAGGVAHDFNNILSVILAHSEMALEDLDAEHPLRDSLSEIHNAGQRAASLTRQLLAFSRKQVFEPTVLDLNQLAESMDKMLRRLVGASIHCETAFARPLYRVKADAAQLEQVLLNLVVNARDAMPEGGRIRIETRNADFDLRSLPRRVTAEPGPYAVLSVTDSGCGMDQATLARIFEPFFTTKPPGKGTGMGLSTVYGIVRQTGGFITVDSEPGQGTTFCVHLPRAPEGFATQAVDESIAALPNGTGTILVVENDGTVRAVVRRILELRGYKILEAPDGEQALLLLKQNRKSIDLVLSELVMPGLNGIDLAKRVREDYKRSKFLLMSGFADLPADNGDAELLDSHSFLQKPFTTESLVRKVHAVLTAR